MPALVIISLFKHVNLKTPPSYGRERWAMPPGSFLMSCTCRSQARY